MGWKDINSPGHERGCGCASCDLIRQKMGYEPKVDPHDIPCNGHKPGCGCEACQDVRGKMDRRVRR